MEINDIYYLSFDKLSMNKKRYDLRKLILINNLINKIISIDRKNEEEKWFDLILENFD